MKFGFVGGTYMGQSKNATGERCINLYPEPIQSGNGKAGARSYFNSIAGLAVTHQLPDQPLRCLYSGDGQRVFAVSGITVYELFQTAAANPSNSGLNYNVLGTVRESDRGNTPCQIFANGVELFIVAGSGGYVADGLTVKHVVDGCMGGFLDGYFVLLDGIYPGTSKQFQISALYDGASWNALDFANVEGAPDNIVSMICDHRQIIFLKQQSSEFFWDSGNPDFPIERVDGSFVEQGCIATWSARKIDNTVMWLGGDERGAGVVWRMQGYTPSRVSNFAVENWIQGYTRQGWRIDDAIASVEQIQGHTFYHLHFPSANPLKPTRNDPQTVPPALGATWTYDCATGLWHERGHWDPVQGLWGAHWARYHCYAWGMHLVGGGDALAPGAGGPTTGNVYSESIDYHDENGTPLRWLRSAPHIADSRNRKLFFSNLWIDVQAGVGLSTLVDGDGNEREPVIMRRASNDGGNTWGPEKQMAIGKTGEYSFRARIAGNCGSARNRCEEISGSDPVQIAIVDADMEAVVGTS
jgi:hypothetical protein